MPGDEQASRPIIVSIVQSTAGESSHHRSATRSIAVGVYSFTGKGVRPTGCAMIVNATESIGVDVRSEPVPKGTLVPRHD
jgi:hypothetical protein